MRDQRFKKLLKGEYVEKFLERFLAPADDPSSPLPRTMDALMDEVRDIMGTKGLLSPAAMAAELMVRHGQEDNPAFGDFMRQTQKLRDKPEPAMKFLGKEHGYLLMGLSHLYAVETGEPVMLMFGDYSKMGLTNEYFRGKMAADAGVTPDRIPEKEANAKTDKAMQVVAKMIPKGIKRVNPKAQTLEGRLGGDEFCVVAVGVDPDKFAETVGVTNARIEEQVACMGLQDVAPEAERGFGAGLAVIDMREIEDPATVIRDLDGAVQVNKNNTTLMRRGLMDVEIMTAEIESAISFGRITAPADPVARGEFVKQKGAEAARQAKHSAGYLRKLNPVHSPDGATIEKFDSHVESVLATGSPRGDFPTLFDRDMAGAARPAGLGPLASLYDRRMALAERHLQEQGITLSRNQRKHLEMCVRDIGAVDPSADRMMPGEMVRLLRIHAAEGQEYAEQSGLAPDDRSTALGVSFHVIGGANEELGHDIADILQKHLGHKLMEDALLKMGIPSVQPPVYDISHHGAGAFTVLLKPGVAGGLDAHEMAQEFERALLGEVADLNEQRITEFLKPHGIELDEDYMRGEGLITFGDIRDKKKREVTQNGKKYESRVDGVHVAVSGLTVPDDPALDGGAFIDTLHKETGLKMDAVRALHVVRHEATTHPAMHRPTTMPAHALTLQEARTAHIESLHTGTGRTSLISDLMRHTSLPPGGACAPVMPTIPPSAKVPSDIPEI